MIVRRGPHTVRCISYNLLADQYSYHHQYCPPHFLAWPHRLATILRQLVSLDADLLFLQEVEQVDYNQQLRTTLGALGYDSVHCSTPEDGANIQFPLLAYKTSRFEPWVTSGGATTATAVRFCDVLKQWHPPAADPAQGGDDGDAFHSALQNNREGACMALLRLRTQSMGGSSTSNISPPPPEGHVICAVATHLHWDPRLPDVKTAQAAVLCQQITHFMQQHGASDAAVVIGGDFNSMPKKTRPDAFDPHVDGDGFVSGAYTLLTQGVVGVDNPDHPTARRGLAACAQYPLHAHGLQLASVNAAVNHGREPLFTNCTTTFRGCLDYVFFSRGKLQAVGALEMPYQVRPEDEVPEDVVFPAIPNEVFPSDHLPVGGDLVLL